MRRPPRSLLLLTLFGFLLAMWMTINGLYIRVLDDFMHFEGLPLLLMETPQASQRSNPISLMIVEPEKVAWPMLVLGLGWPGALSALWLKLRWGYRSVGILGTLSLTALGLGTMLAMLILLCFLAPSTRRWASEREEPGGA